MTADEIKAARVTLGGMWGLGRPLAISELAALMRLTSATVAAYEDARTTPPSPFCVALRMMLAGAHPPDMLKILRL